MTRITAAIWKPATFDPAYPHGKFFARSLADIDKLICHDAQGYRAYLQQGHRPGATASWLASVLTDGTIWQHYELEMATWTSGNPPANKTGVGVEHESVPGDFTAPETNAQVEADAHIYSELRKLCPHLKAPVLGQGFEEHRRVAPGTTSCPNDRIRWNDIAAIIVGGADMTPEQEAKLDLVIKLLGYGKDYAGDPEIGTNSIGRIDAANVR